MYKNFFISENTSLKDIQKIQYLPNSKILDIMKSNVSDDLTFVQFFFIKSMEIYLKKLG